jgi:hypothetical protein
MAPEITAAAVGPVARKPSTRGRQRAGSRRNEPRPSRYSGVNARLVIRVRSSARTARCGQVRGTRASTISRPISSSAP